MSIDLTRKAPSLLSNEPHLTASAEPSASDYFLSAESPREIIEILNQVFSAGRVQFRLAEKRVDSVSLLLQAGHSRKAYFAVQSPKSGEVLAQIEWTSGRVTDTEIQEFLGDMLPILILKFENWSLKSRLDSQLASSIRALSRIIEAKDRYTGGHTQRVYRYSGRLISEMGLPEAQSEKIRLAGLLHDIGKIGVPDRILLKPASLDDAEWDIMRSHTEMGYTIVSEIAGLEEVAEILKHHHERWDGTGYSQGLKGEGIPIESRVIAVADVFDAITTKRPYREASSFNEARSIITSLSGSHFDPMIVDQFESVFDGLVDDATIALRVNAPLSSSS